MGFWKRPSNAVKCYQHESTSDHHVKSWASVLGTLTPDVGWSPRSKTRETKRRLGQNQTRSTLYSVLASADLHRKRLAQTALLVHYHAGRGHTAQLESQRDPNEREHVETAYTLNNCQRQRMPSLKAYTPTRVGYSDLGRCFCPGRNGLPG